MNVDVGNVITVKFLAGKIEDTDIDKLNSFCELLQDLDHEKWLEEVIEEIDKLLMAKILEVSEKGLKQKYVELEEKIVEAIKGFHFESLQAIDREIHKIMMTRVKECSQRRYSNSDGIHNFTDRDIGEDVKKLLNMGTNSVPVKILKRTVMKG